MPSNSFQLTYDTSEVMHLLRRLSAVSRELRAVESGRLRDAAGTVAGQLVGGLQAGARGTPQAGIVASSARVKRDRVPAVQVGGPTRVGHRGTPAGEILWGSEHGGHNFQAARNASGYWIEPTVKRFREGGAVDAYTRAVVQILQSNGVL